MAEDADNTQLIPTVEKKPIRKVEPDFEIRTDSLKKLGQLGALRRAPAAPELQLDGSHSWIRYHHLECCDHTLALWTTDNRCTIYACLPVSAMGESRWSASVDSTLFNSVMGLVGGAKYKVVLEESFVLLTQGAKYLRIPIRQSPGNFRKPPESPEDVPCQVSRKELSRVLTFLVGATANPSAPDPCDVDRKQTVSFYRDGIAIASDKGVERLARTSPLPYDMHVATIHARRLSEWLKHIDSDVFVSRVEVGGAAVFAFRDRVQCHRMWLPARPDGRIRQKVEAGRHPPVLLVAQLSRRPLLESLRILSAVAFERRLLLDFSVEDSAKASLRLATDTDRTDGERISSADANHVVERFSGAPEVGGRLRVQVSVEAIRGELDRFSGPSVVIVCRQPPGGLSLLSADDLQQGLSADAVSDLLNRDRHIESVLRAKPVFSHEGVADPGHKWESRLGVGPSTVSGSTANRS